MYLEAWIICHRTSGRIVFSTPLAFNPKLLPNTDTVKHKLIGFVPPNYSHLNCMQFVLRHWQVSYMPENESGATKLTSLRYRAAELVTEVVNRRREPLMKGTVLQEHVYIEKVQQAKSFLDLKLCKEDAEYLITTSELHGITVEEAALYILMKHDTSKAMLVRSETERLKWNREIDNLSTVEAASDFICRLKAELPHDQV